MNSTSITLQAVVTADGRLELLQPLKLAPGPVEITVTVTATGANGRVAAELPPLKEPRIVDWGRGPSIEGTRITVYDVLDYHRKGHHHTYIAVILGVASDEVLAAIRYIEEHHDEVWAVYNKILERDARGNPPELQAKLDALHAKCQALWAERRRQGLMPEVKVCESS